MRFFKTMAILGTCIAGVAGATVSAQAQQNESDASQMCRVTVDRSQPNGIFDVTRQVFEDGSCNCFIYTGRETQANNVEAQVNRIVQSRRCPGARPMVVDGAGPGAGASAGAGSAGAINSMIPVVLAAGAAGGVVIALADDDDDDTGTSP